MPEANAVPQVEESLDQSATGMSIIETALNSLEARVIGHL
jgi:hypothetical protein